MMPLLQLQRVLLRQPNSLRFIYTRRDAINKIQSRPDLRERTAIAETKAARSCVRRNAHEPKRRRR